MFLHLGYPLRFYRYLNLVPSSECVRVKEALREVNHLNKLEQNKTENVM